MGRAQMPACSVASGSRSPHGLGGIGVGGVDNAQKHRNRFIAGPGAIIVGHGLAGRHFLHQAGDQHVLVRTAPINPSMYSGRLRGWAGGQPARVGILVELLQHGGDEGDSAHKRRR